MVFEPLLAPLAFVVIVAVVVTYALYRRARRNGSRMSRGDSGARRS